MINQISAPAPVPKGPPGRTVIVWYRTFTPRHVNFCHFDLRVASDYGPSRANERLWIPLSLIINTNERSYVLTGTSVGLFHDELRLFIGRPPRGRKDAEDWPPGWRVDYRAVLERGINLPLHILVWINHIKCLCVSSSIRFGTMSHWSCDL